MTQSISNLADNIDSFGCFPPLSANFPESAEMPFYLYGDRVYFESLDEYGIVIGRFYAFNRNLARWQWKYLIVSDQNLAINGT